MRSVNYWECTEVCTDMKLQNAQRRVVGIGGLVVQTIVSRVLTQFEATIHGKVSPFAARAEWR